MAGVQEGQAPKALNVEVLRRFMAPEALASLLEQYVTARAPMVRAVDAPTEEQFRIANLARKIGRKGAAEVENLTYRQVDFVVERVAKWQFLNASDTNQHGTQSN